MFQNITSVWFSLGFVKDANGFKVPGNLEGLSLTANFIS